ncbi:hypothetical protein Fmac_028236 [Flemingia macrophylla]|uniref:F-box protein SKIP5 n=1 Tax=Flemingia macrophylla TaxID=520843 RepID=A0ABD1L6X5_9FABA
MDDCNKLLNDWMTQSSHKQLNSKENYKLNSVELNVIGCLRYIFTSVLKGVVLIQVANAFSPCLQETKLISHQIMVLKFDASTKFVLASVFVIDSKFLTDYRPGDTILIAAGGSHCVANIQIKKPLCLIGAGELPDDTTLICSRGSDSALELLSTCKLANLTVRAELGCCLLHRKGRLTIDGCILQCESNPLDYLSCPIVSTASSSEVLASQTKSHGDGVFVSQTRIEGGAKAVLTSGDLALQRVRVIYARTSLLFWFDVEQMCDQIDHDKPL